MGGTEQANEQQSGGISTVYGVSGRRRRCRSATRVSFVTAGRNAVGGTAAAAVKILIRRIGESGSNLCAKYYYILALESSSDIYRSHLETLRLKSPPITRRTTINYVASPKGKQLVGT